MREHVEQKIWNAIVIRNFGSPLHSWEWARAKELSGETVKWFMIDDDRGFIAVPIMVRSKLRVIRAGWIPHGIPYKGELGYVKKRLKQFLYANGLAALVTSFYGFMNASQLPESFLRINCGKSTETLVLRLTGETEDTLLKRFNKTTRKHIRRAEQQGIQCENLKDRDFQHFWEFYEKFTIQNRFEPFITYPIFKRLIMLSNDSSFGLNYIAKKAVREGLTMGYLIALQMGERAQELMRIDLDSFKNEGVGPKFLTWAVIRSALERGVSIYDFGGVRRDVLPGIYQFKRGFGGELKRSNSFYKILFTI